MRDPRSELTNFSSAVATEVVAGVCTCRGVTLLASLGPFSRQSIMVRLSQIIDLNETAKPATTCNRVGGIRR